ncbi:MAG TPA: hypothetical protein VF152_15215 [Acidimicrobiia bacterium]
MSSLWTPSGEHRPESPEPGAPEPEPAGGPGPETDPELAEELGRLREQLAATPVADIVANHAVGLWQLAIVHLAPEAGAPPRLEQARLAIDAMATLVEGLADRLGEHETPLRDALAQLRLAFVQVTEGAEAEPDEA